MITTYANNTLFKLAATLWYMLAVTGTFSLSPVSQVALMSGIALYVLFSIENTLPHKVKKQSLLIGILFGLFTSFANYSNYSAGSFVLNISKALLYGIGISFFYYAVLCRIYFKASKMEKTKIKPENSKKVFFICFIVIMAVWTVFYLCYFPGIVNEDTVWQLEQSLGISAWSNHHPVAHSFVIGTIYKVGTALTGTVNGGVAFICVIQMLMSSLVFSYTVSSMCILGMPAPLYYGAAVLYAIHPICVIFGFYVTKDLWFTVSVLLMLTTSLRLSKNRYGIREMVLLVIGALGTGLFRSNGIVVLAVFSLFYFFKFKKKIKISVIIPGVLVICILITGVGYNLLGAKPVDTVEYLSVPLQQIAGIYAGGNRITDTEDAEYLNSIVPVYRLAETYNPHLSDNVKNLIRSEGDQSRISDAPGLFAKFWLRNLLRFPDSYIQAYVDQTSGFWYPERSTLSYLTGNPENELDITDVPIITGSVSGILKTWTEGTRGANIFAWLFNNGIVTWLMFVFFGLAVVRESDNKYLFSLPVSVWATLIVSTPIASDNRYIYAVFVSLPVLLTVALCAKPEKSKT